MAPSQQSEPGLERPEHITKGLAAAHELFRRGELDYAEQACRNLLSQMNDDADLFALLGMVLIQKGDPEGSIVYLENAAALQPDAVRMRNNLGIAFKRVGRLQEAEAAYRRAISIDGGYAQAHYNLGVVLIERGDFRDAAASFQAAVNLDTEFLEARRNLAHALLGSNQFAESADEFRRFLDISPDDVAANLALVEILRQLEDYDKARKYLDRLLEANPDHVGALFQKCLVLQEQGALGEARDVLTRIVDADPEHAGAHNLLGVVSQALGHLDEAVRCFRCAISIEPLFAEAHRNLALARRHVEVDEDVRRTRRLMDIEMNEVATMHAEFDLAKIDDDLGEIDDAFMHLSRANRLKRRSIQYDVGQDRIFFERLKRTFDPAFFSMRQGWGEDDTTPIFIVGMPRSGTTLVEQIIASHPRAWGAGETLDLDRLLWANRGSDQPQAWCETMASLAKDDMRKLAADYLTALKRSALGADRITDKTPGNFHYIGMIRVMLPRAKIVNCIRNPLDMCFSCFQTYFTRGIHFAYELRELGIYYRLYAGLMEHWRTTLPGFVYDLRYEQLLHDQETETRNLLEFCGLEWDSACLDFHRTERPVQTASVVQVRQPIYQSSIGRAARYANHLGPLRDALGDIE